MPGDPLPALPVNQRKRLDEINGKAWRGVASPEEIAEREQILATIEGRHKSRADAERDRILAVEEARAVAGMGFGRLVLIVAVGILLARGVELLITFLVTAALSGPR